MRLWAAVVVCFSHYFSLFACVFVNPFTAAHNNCSVVSVLRFVHLLVREEAHRQPLSTGQIAARRFSGKSLEILTDGLLAAAGGCKNVFHREMELPCSTRPSIC
jgi:hypothetical protein